MVKIVKIVKILIMHGALKSLKIILLTLPRKYWSRRTLIEPF